LASTGIGRRTTAYACVSALSFTACAGGKGRNPEPDVGQYAYLYQDATRHRAENELRRQCPGLPFGAHGYPIHLDDGVNRCEALVLALHYYQKAGVTYGGLAAPVDADSFWLVPMRFGTAGRASLPIRIDKVSGTGSVLYAKGEPSFTPVSIQTSGGPL
jgi:hypothetical protein